MKLAAQNPAHQRTRLMALGFFLGAVCALAPASRAQEASHLPLATSVASPRAYVSLAPVPRGHAFEIAVVVGLMRGFHINAHKPLDPYLIPTTLTAKLPRGIREVETLYPEGTKKKLAFSENPMLVYSGRVTIRLRLAAQAHAPLGRKTIALELRYQACNDAACLPPVTVPVSAEFVVARAGAKVRAIAPEIFSAHGHAAGR